MAHILNAESLTMWKDTNGLLKYAPHGAIARALQHTPPPPLAIPPHDPSTSVKSDLQAQETGKQTQHNTQIQDKIQIPASSQTHTHTNPPHSAPPSLTHVSYQSALTLARFGCPVVHRSAILIASAHTPHPISIIIRNPLELAHEGTRIWSGNSAAIYSHPTTTSPAVLASHPIASIPQPFAASSVLSLQCISLMSGLELLFVSFDPADKCSPTHGAGVGSGWEMTSVEAACR